MKRWQLLLVALVLLLLLSGGADVVVSAITNGPRVGPSTSVGEDGLIDADPYQLAEDAGEDPETYALARCLASEHASDPDLYLVCVGWAVKNKARERGLTVVELLTGGAGTAGDGYFGAQNAAAGAKYASTAHDPHQRHADAARSVISGAQPDPTGGATHFFSPASQDDFAERAAAGEERFRKYAGRDADYIMRTWAAPGGLYPQGAVPVVPAGIDPRRLTLWRAA